MKNLLNSKGFTLIELIFTMAIIGVLSSLLVISHFITNEGALVGRVVNFSKQGVYWKTWELQFASQGQEAATSGFREFSVDSKREDIVRELADARNSRKKVMLCYNQNIFLRPWQGATTYFVNKVVLLNNKLFSVLIHGS